MGNILAIIGSGDLGQQIAHHAISDKHFANVVFFDDYTDKQEVNGYRVIGKTADVSRCYEAGLFNKLLIGVGYNHMGKRKELFEMFADKIPFANIIHSSCWVDSTVELGSGIVVYPGCMLDAHVRIGNNVLINAGGCIAHDTVIGQHSFLSPAVALAGFINIGEQCIIGINTTIIDNITLVPMVRTGGGTVVIKNIETNGLYVGNPAKFIR